MKLCKLVLLVAILIPAAAFAQAHPCPSGTLANVLGTSCSIGNATFTFQTNFNGFHQIDDATNTLQTTFLAPDVIGFVPVVSGTQNGFRLIANFDEATGPTQSFSFSDVNFSYDVQVNGSFEILSETAAVDGSTTQIFSALASAFDEHCFTNQFCIQVAPQFEFFFSLGSFNVPSASATLNIPGLASTGNTSGLPFTTQLTAFASSGDHAVLNSASFLYTIVPQTPLPPLAKLKYSEIQIPGAVETDVGGINDAGDIAGSFLDAAGTAHGFVKDKDGVHEITVPNAANTSPEALNNRGDVVGSFVDAAGNFHGFLLQKGVFSTIDFPGAVDTVPFDINEHGVITGVYQFDFSSVHGFRMDANGFVTIDDPAQHAPGFTEAFGINNRDDIVGFYLDDAFSTHGFLLTHNNFQEVVVPGGFQPFAEDINDAQSIVGSYEDLNLFSHGFVQQGTRFGTVDFPGSAGTFPFQINASGQIVGEFFDDAGKLHSFLAERVSDDGKEESPADSSHRHTPMRKCTEQDPPGVRKDMKNLHTCPVK